MMKKLETVKLIASLEKAGRKTKKAIWSDLATRMSGIRRGKTTVNVDELNVLAEKFKGKTIIVPGKILARGELTQKVNVSAASISSTALAKIQELKGSYIPLVDLAEKAEKLKANELVIIE
jgi:large subunit ribosomal protein L18e